MNEFQRAWLDELRSGRHTKCTGSMRKTRPDADSYCTLGVANLVLDGGWKIFSERGDVTLWSATDVVDDDYFLPEEFRNKLGLTIEDEVVLYKINDGHMAGNTPTFEEIADILEAFFNGAELPDVY